MMITELRGENAKDQINDRPARYDLTPLDELQSALNAVDAGNVPDLFQPPANPANNPGKSEQEQREIGRIAGTVQFAIDEMGMKKKSAVNIVCSLLRGIPGSGFDTGKNTEETIERWMRPDRLARYPLTLQEYNRVQGFEGWKKIADEKEVLGRVLRPYSDTLWPRDINYGVVLSETP